ncbi:MAG: hypothetical protein OXG29_05255 [Gammaproteobacteria bacterium]|nr:hypothetical protein [Gammaproteobacteria bacterium]
MTQLKRVGEPTKDCAVIHFCAEHLNVFRDGITEQHNPDDTRDSKPARSFSRELRDADPMALPERRMTRSEVFQLASCPTASLPIVCAAVMAWGGMRPNNWKTLVSGSSEWLDVAGEIRGGAISRKEAYGQLNVLRRKKKLKGAGPAYFTKLIYFLTPRDGRDLKPGYIMDQWAGCSINLLAGRDVVLMNVTMSWKRQAERLIPKYEFNAADENTADNYESFCCAVDCLSELCSLDVSQIDRELFSRGGSKPESWRRHVVDHRSPYICR